VPCGTSKKGLQTKSFTDHDGDVMGVAVAPDGNHFVSCAIDTYAFLWDLRAAKYMFKFGGHESDVNAINYMKNSHGFGTASDDATVRMFDVRAGRDLQVFSSETISCGVTSCDFSISGRFLFGGYDDFNCVMWDTLTGDTVHNLAGHENRVSTLGVNVDGTALCTGGWDNLLKIWA